MAPRGEGEFFQAFIRIRSRPGGAWLVHPDLRSMLVADAEKLGVSLTDAAVAILAEKFGVPYETTPRKTKPTADGEELNLRIPWPLYEKIKRFADTTERSRRRPWSANDQIRLALCAHYGLQIPPKPRITRRRGAAKTGGGPIAPSRSD
jgi:hypothetical protein